MELTGTYFIKISAVPIFGGFPQPIRNEQGLEIKLMKLAVCVELSKDTKVSSPP